MALLTLLAVSLPAQETGGVAPAESRKGTIFKNRAPVAKKLLRVKFPRPQVFTLPNGVRVYVLEDHRFPLFRCSLQMKAGSLLETKPGVADMTAALMDEGTQTRTAPQIAQETEDLGGTLLIAASAEQATLTVGGLSEHADQLLALMKDVLLHPSFPADRLARVKFQATASLAQRRSSPNSLLAQLSGRVFYGDTPYARITPTAEQIDAITREDLQTFHTAYYRPNSAVLGITGDVNAKTIVRKFQEALAEWKPGAQSSSLPPADFAPKTTTRIHMIDRPGSAQTLIQVGNLAITRLDPDYIPLVVANRILGGGSSARLFQNLREDKGYTYGVYSTLTPYKWLGLWGANTSVRTAVTEPALHEFFVEFRRLQEEPVPQAELDRAKRALVGSFARTLESPDGILARFMELVENGLPLDYWDTYPGKIDAVSAAEVQRVARKYLGEGRVQVIVVGEKAKIEAGLKRYGPVQVYDTDAHPIVGASASE
jgi:zinc protease